MANLAFFITTVSSHHGYVCFHGRNQAKTHCFRQKLFTLFHYALEEAAINVSCIFILSCTHFTEKLMRGTS